MTVEELDALLKEVRVFNGYARTYSYLSDAQRSAVAMVLLPVIKRHIEQASAESTRT